MPVWMHNHAYKSVYKTELQPKILRQWYRPYKKLTGIMNFDKCTYIYTLHHFLHISLHEQWSITGHVYKLSKSV